jgi:hypothetical protein
MAYSLIAHTTSHAGGVSGSVDTTGATILIACVSATSPVPAPIDSKSNSWTLAVNFPGSFGGAQAIYYSINPTVGSGHTFTSQGTTPSGCFMAFSGANTTAPLDQVSAGANGAITVQPGSLTPSQDGCLLVLTVGVDETTGVSVDSGFSNVDFEAVGSGVQWSSYSGYFVQPTAAAINPTVTSGGTDSGPTYTIMASFLPATEAAFDLAVNIQEPIIGSNTF